MSNKFYLSLPIMIAFLAIIALPFSCMRNASTSHQMSREETIARGKYLVTVMSCNDCHSPKIFTNMGPVVDTTKMLSGHPQNSQLPKIDTNALHPGYWYTGAPDLTAWVGPWGISYTANLTPDSATGIGAWTEDNFKNAMRTGKHLGMSGARDILPPMPYNFIAQLTDEDMNAVYTYLRSLPPISNKVPAPVSPPDVMAMAMGK